MGTHIRLLNPQDIPHAMRLKDDAGWNQTALDWQRFLSANPGGCFAAEIDSRLIGTSATIIYGGKLAWIGMVVVDSAFRGQGIGTTLLNRAIDYLDSCKIPCMKLDATPQGRPLYEKFGFVAEYGLERW
ncbi:MAG: GNAT family N-acetyltransferase, partial [Candidatus Acidiferrales bacterium]